MLSSRLFRCRVSCWGVLPARRQGVNLVERGNAFYAYLPFSTPFSPPPLLFGAVSGRNLGDVKCCCKSIFSFRVIHVMVART